MADLLREIDEELQREHMMALWGKYKKLVIGLALALVVATASYSAWKEHAEAKRIKQSRALYDILGQNSRSEKEKLEALQGYISQFAGERQTILARFVATNLYVHSGDTAQAVAALENIAQDKMVSQHLRDYAALMAIQLQLDTGDPAALHVKLEPFAAKDGAWRYTAVAMRGALFARSGDHEQAEKYFTALAENPTTPASLREYARDVANYYATKR